ncbi:FHIPEP family type III secretion protein, partial [Pandoraea pneumonica]
IAEHGARVQDPYDLTALVRLSLGRAITQSVFPGSGDLEVVGLDANLERILTQALSAGGGTGLEPGLADTLLRETQAAVTRQ